MNIIIASTFNISHEGIDITIAPGLYGRHVYIFVSCSIIHMHVSIVVMCVDPAIKAPSFFAGVAC